MYHSWIQDKDDQAELARSHGILIGSFTNYEAAKKMLKIDNPDFSSTDEEFEQSTRIILEARKKAQQDSSSFDDMNKPKRRRRRIIKDSRDG